MANARDTYEERILQKNAEANAPAPQTQNQSFEQASRSVGAQTAQNSASQGDLLGTAGGAMMMSGNPYAIAAGLGLQVYSAGERNKREAAERQRREYNDRIMRRQELMNRIAQQGIQ